MKNHSVPSAFYSLVIGFAGLAAPVSAPQAADIGMPVYEPLNTVTAQSQKPAVPAPGYLNEQSHIPKGAQGPIRTDDFSKQTAKVDAETLRRDLQMNRYPMNNGVGIP